MRLVLTAKDVSALRKMRPRTHEIGGTLVVDGETGAIQNMHLAGGDVCRDDKGQLLPGKVCSVRHPTGPVVFHTHPRANRPSSTDLRNAAVAGNTHLVVTPLGIWAYKATSELARAWQTWDSDRRRRAVLEWRFLGHRCQRETQHGDTTSMRTWMRRAGFSCEYVPYTEVESGAAWKIFSPLERKKNT